MNITKIPDVMQSTITSYLPLKDSLKLQRLSKVLKEFSISLNKINLVAPREPSSLTAIDALHSLLKNVISVKIIRFSPEFLEHLLKEQQHHNHLNEKFKNILEDPTFCKHFKAVHLGVLYHLPIIYNDREKWIYSFLGRILSYSTDLRIESIRDLSCHYNIENSYHQFNKITLSQAKKIQRLILDRMILNDSSIDSLKKLKELKKLICNQLILEETNSVSALLSPKVHAALRNLESLEVFDARQDTINLDGIKALSQNKNLKILCIKMYAATDEDLQYFYQKENGEFPFPRLSFCLIEFCGGNLFSLETKNALKEKRKDIQELRLSG